MIKEFPREKSLGEFTFYRSTDAITSAMELADDPNKRVDCKNSYNLTSIEDANYFCNNFNHNNNYNNGYTKLQLGDAIRILDGTYNIYYQIAGFDCEYNRPASDGTVYDNGYGIMLVPYWYGNESMKGYWNNSDTTSGGYKSSLAQGSANYVGSIIKSNVLGDHLVTRKALLSSRINSNGNANNFEWVNVYATLPSLGQLFGFFNYNNTIYDDGEANYKLPIFNYFSWAKTFDYWLRNIGDYSDTHYKVYNIMKQSGYHILNYVMSDEKYYMPLLYIR